MLEISHFVVIYQDIQNRFGMAKGRLALHYPLLFWKGADSNPVLLSSGSISIFSAFTYLAPGIHCHKAFTGKRNFPLLLACPSNSHFLHSPSPETMQFAKLRMQRLIVGPQSMKISKSSQLWLPDAWGLLGQKQRNVLQRPLQRNKRH